MDSLTLVAHTSHSSHTYLVLQARLTGGFVNGYRTATISLHYEGDTDRVICKGEYELWWVQRTRHNFVVQKKKPFGIYAPDCEFNKFTDDFYDYCIVGNECYVADYD